MNRSEAVRHLVAHGLEAWREALNGASKETNPPKDGDGDNSV
ncbi:hypothetical protein [Novacetimonas sp. GS1]